MWNYTRRPGSCQPSLTRIQTKRGGEGTETNETTHPLALALLVVARDHLPIAHSITETVRPVVLPVPVDVPAARADRAPIDAPELVHRGSQVLVALVLVLVLVEAAHDGHARALELPMGPLGREPVRDARPRVGERARLRGAHELGRGERGMVRRGRLRAVPRIGGVRVRRGAFRGGGGAAAACAPVGAGLAGGDGGCVCDHGLGDVGGDGYDGLGRGGGAFGSPI